MYAMRTGAGSSEVKLAFAAGSQDLIDPFVEEVRRMGNAGLPVYCVAEFAPTVECHWIPWQPFESQKSNRERIAWHLRNARVVYNCILTQPRQPYWAMRWLGWRLFPGRTYLFNENFGHFPLHPRGAAGIARHVLWRLKNLVRQEVRPGGTLYTFLWRLKHPLAWERPLYVWLARRRRALKKQPLRSLPEPDLEPGITVVIPSRDGRALLEQLLPQIEPGLVRKVIVVDNGSGDGTAELASEFVEVLSSPEPLSFAAAVNRGILASRTEYTCLLNNDMVLEEGFFAALHEAFARVPDLFGATAQIFPPEGKRREETGKAVYSPQGERDFPLRCEPPLEGEDLTPVLYGSGGCSLFDTRKLLRLGLLKESFRPAYVEDLDLGWRGWQQGWPTVYVAGARVVHHHRSTTGRFLAASAIELAIEQNYLRWILSSVGDAAVFARLWQAAVRRLNLLAAAPEPAPVAMYGLRFAALEKPYYAWDRPAEAVLPEERILALGSGQMACFPGRGAPGRPCVVVATCYMPYPLSHGGAVRMYNLMREAARDYTLVLVSFVEEWETPAEELRELCVEVITVKRAGSHYRYDSRTPKAVEDFASEAFAAALGWVRQRWQPEIVQLEFTQMAQYARHCAPARTVLVEHDITVDLYEQLLERDGDYDQQRELGRWREFEPAAWREVDAVVVMSEKDGRAVQGARRVEVVPNGVDTEWYRPSVSEPEAGRLLFIGSFAHLPNLLALEWFLREAWPHLKGSTLHVIAGRAPDYYREFYRERVQVELEQPGIEMEAFVADVRPAYARAEVVIAPLQASAGTNIKVLEAMACGKAVVATAGGVNGLDLRAGEDYLRAESGEEFAAAVRELQSKAERRRDVERNARRRAEAAYSWQAAAVRQRALYESLRA
jgi:GT2 family glycosyltransferase/glycosyltransferase involved in cell wall biosynthesis